MLGGSFPVLYSRRYPEQGPAALQDQFSDLGDQRLLADYRHAGQGGDRAQPEVENSATPSCVQGFDFAYPSIEDLVRDAPTSDIDSYKQKKHFAFLLFTLNAKTKCCDSGELTIYCWFIAQAVGHRRRSC